MIIACDGVSWFFSFFYGSAKKTFSFTDPAAIVVRELQKRRLRDVPAVVNKVPEHIAAAHGVEMGIAPQRIADHGTVESIFYSDSPGEVIRIPCRGIKHHFRIMEFMAAEPCSTHRAVLYAGPFNVTDHAPGRHPGFHRETRHTSRRRSQCLGPAILS